MSSAHRVRWRQDLNPLYLPFYDRLCELLPIEWAPYDGFRSFALQDQKYAQGRTAPGPIVTKARGGESAHCYGCGNDWTIWEPNGVIPIWMEKTDLRWQRFIDAVEEAGLRAGADFGDVDHCELRISCDWTAILEVEKKDGSAAAQEAIRAAMVPRPPEASDDPESPPGMPA